MPRYRREGSPSTPLGSRPPSPYRPMRVVETRLPRGSTTSLSAHQHHLGPSPTAALGALAPGCVLCSLLENQVIPSVKDFGC